ncbi:hypothetical protein QT937_013500, partial [Xanthomonas campestris pv. campestris]|uniref:hypothetical protein n=1 Tax=Xanthomonas campestris TaxID=339 RepID=UPI00358E4E02
GTTPCDVPVATHLPHYKDDHTNRSTTAPVALPLQLWNNVHTALPGMQMALSALAEPTASIWII